MSPKIHVYLELLSVTLFGNRISEDAIKLQWNFRVSHKYNMSGALTRGGILGHSDTDIRKAVWREKQGLEGGCICKSSNNKDCQKPPGARRSNERSFPRAFRGNMVFLAPWFQTSSLQNREKINFCYFKLTDLSYFVTAAKGNYDSLLTGIPVFTRTFSIPK